MCTREVGLVKEFLVVVLVEKKDAVLKECLDEENAVSVGMVCGRFILVMVADEGTVEVIDDKDDDTGNSKDDENVWE